MRVKINESLLELVEGDITDQMTEAIVNAANRTLLGGGGVDGAIHRAGGPRILEECRKLGGCNPGDAKLTTGGNLPAPYIIHAVGPVYRDGRHHEARLLESAYRRSLEIAAENGIESVSFPSISTGAYGYPLDKAAYIAIRTVTKYLESHPEMKLVRFVLYGQKSFESYAKALEDVLRSDDEEEESPELEEEPAEK